MIQSLDYDIFAKQIKIEQNPKEIEVIVSCGDVKVTTTVTKEQKYQFPSHLICPQCQCKNDINIKLTYTVDEREEPIILCAKIPFEQIRKQHSLFDSWITLFHENTERVAGAILLCLLCSCSSVSEIDEKVTMNVTKDYFPEHHSSHTPTSETYSMTR